MSDKISRRDFLKITGMGAAISAVITGCGPMSRYIVRRPYTQMPEYNQTGLSTYYASTCRECPAGCGVIVRTKEGHALTIEGNQNHPVNQGKLCSRGITVHQGLYNPDRVKAPRLQARGDSAQAKEISWDEAINIVRDGLNQPPDQVAFLLGMAPDHLFDLVSEITQGLGAPAPLRYSALTSLESRATLLEAVNQISKTPSFPYFDLANAEVAFSFGADFLQSWLSPVAYSRAYGKFRQGRETRRGYLVVFEPRQSLTSSNADEWIPIRPGSEALVAQALLVLVTEIRSASTDRPSEPVNVTAAVEASGITETKLRELASLFASAAQPLAIPGGFSLAREDGVSIARTILALNDAVGNFGQPGGVYLSPNTPTESKFAAVQDLINQMNAGAIKTLFIHGVNPVFELPQSSGFAEALAKVPQVISFATFPDETAELSDYIFPDHSPSESFGYQRSLAGADRRIYSAIQPVVAPLYNTRATSDVLLAAVQAVGGPVASAVNYGDEVNFIQQKIAPLISAGGAFTAPDIQTFWSLWLQNGGWWPASPELATPSALAEPVVSASAPVLPDVEEGKQFYLVTYANHFGDGSGANRPWLQEVPDSMTTVTWNSWVEINPQTAAALGLHNDDVVTVSTSAGEIQASVYLYPAIRPDTIAIPFGQGHTALGRWAEGRGVNPGNLIASESNTAGDLAYGAVIATLTPTGTRRPLAAVESKLGVYGEE